MRISRTSKSKLNKILPYLKGKSENSRRTSRILFYCSIILLTVLVIGANAASSGSVSGTATVTVTSTSDPTKQILTGNYTYPDITEADVTAWWNRTQFLLENAVGQNSDGSWGGGYVDMDPECHCTGSHPVIRETAHAVMGYSYAYRSKGDPFYRQQAIEGLEWLLSEQIVRGGDKGAFRWYCTDAGVPHSYPTGLAGRALIEGYRAFGDQRYLDASALAAQWEANQPYNSNANYNAFMISHLAEHYKTTGDTAILDAAVSRSVQMLTYQTSDGYWSDSHNQIAYYHEIITRSLIQLLAVMPEEHPSYQTISEGTHLAINHIVTHQNPDGSMWFSLTDPTGNIEEYVIDGIGIAYLDIGMPVLNILNGLSEFQFNLPYTGINASRIPANSDWREPFEQKPLIAGYLLYFISNVSNTTAPIIIAIDPQDNAINVPTDQTITINFSENISQGTNYNNITLKDSGGNAISTNNTISMNMLIVDPVDSLDYNETYDVFIPSGAVEDSYQNSFLSESTFSFTTTKPRILTTITTWIFDIIGTMS